MAVVQVFVDNIRYREGKITMVPSFSLDGKCESRSWRYICRDRDVGSNQPFQCKRKKKKIIKHPLPYGHSQKPSCIQPSSVQLWSLCRYGEKKQMVHKLLYIGSYHKAITSALINYHYLSERWEVVTRQPVLIIPYESLRNRSGCSRSINAAIIMGMTVKKLTWCRIRQADSNSSLVPPLYCKCRQPLRRYRLQIVFSYFRCSEYQFRHDEIFIALKMYMNS